jgi:hypothetical protein
MVNKGIKQMQKLLDKFMTDSSLANARKLVAYLHKHPMAECMTSVSERFEINIARKLCAANQ